MREARKEEAGSSSETVPRNTEHMVAVLSQHHKGHLGKVNFEDPK